MKYNIIISSFYHTLTPLLLLNVVFSSFILQCPMISLSVCFILIKDRHNIHSEISKHVIALHFQPIMFIYILSIVFNTQEIIRIKYWINVTTNVVFWVSVNAFGRIVGALVWFLSSLSLSLFAVVLCYPPSFLCLLFSCPVQCSTLGANTLS